MRLVMIGTGPFAAPVFRALYDTRHTVAGLVTKPLGPAGEGRPPGGTIRAIAQQHGTPIFDPQDINSSQSHAGLAAFRPDLLVVCDYGQILSGPTLAVARRGGINVHGSLLPKYRGAAPINWAIYHGEKETGVSVIHMTPQVDAGPVIAQESTPIGSEETAVELEARLAEIAARLVVSAIDAVEAERVEGLPQDPSLVSKAPRLKKADGRIDWSRPAEAIRNQVRAMEPWPKTYTFWHRAGRPSLRLILGPVAVQEQACAGVAPGTVVQAEGDRLVVAAGDRCVAVSSLQPAGKRMLPVAEFLRGHRVQPGERFGPE